MDAATRLTRGRILPVALIVASGVSWLVLRDDANPGPPPSAPSGVFFLSPFEETPSQKLSDWASDADVVVEARVTDEQMIEPTDSETIHDGSNLVGRNVSLEVMNTIWRSPDATAVNPTVFTMDAWGWMRLDNGVEREAAVEGAARLESGHKYVIALEWRDRECALGDDAVPAHWSAIGSGAVLPADGNVIGIGELEGSSLELAAVQREATPGTALARFAGQTPSAIAAVLHDMPRVVATDDTDTAASVCGG